MLFTALLADIGRTKHACASKEVRTRCQPFRLLITSFYKWGGSNGHVFSFLI
jgi:hypothetical protein